MNLTPKNANLNLIKTGVLQEKIFFVGNTMIDTLLKQRPNFIKPNIWDKNSLKSNIALDLMGLKFAAKLVLFSVFLSTNPNYDCTNSRLFGFGSCFARSFCL